MKAYELISSPRKWFDGRVYRKGQHCALTAIMVTYSGESFTLVRNRLHARIGTQSVSKWNDSHDWRTVYETLKELNI